MKKAGVQACSVLLLIYVVALHTSMATMEIVAWLLVFISFSTQFAGGWRILRANKPLLAGFAAMTLAVFMSLVTNPLVKPFWFQLGFQRWIFVLCGLTFALQAAWNPKFERRMIYTWMVVCSLTGLYALFQCLTGIDLIRHGVVDPEPGGIFRAVGWFSESLTFAYSIGMSMILISFPSWRVNRAASLITQLCGGLGVLASLSRGAWMFLAGAWMTYVASFYRRWLLHTLTAIVAVVTALSAFNQLFASKIGEMFAPWPGSSSEMRLHLWAGYWRMFLDKPLFGTGFIQGDKLLPAIYLRLGIDEEFVSHAHNNLLQFLGGTGLFGLVAYVFVAWIFLRKTWRLRGKTPWAWSLLLSQLFFHLGGMTQANFIDAIVNHMLMFQWALVLVLEARLAASSEESFAK